MRALPLLLLMPAFASAQQDPESQWAPPPAAVKPAPAAEPPVLPSAPPGTAGPFPPLPAPPPAPPPAVIESPPAPPGPPPDPRRFTLGHLALALMGAVGQSGYFAVRLEAGVVYGWPKRMVGLERARGPTLGVALDLLAAKVSVPSCGSSGICGSRYQAGLALRGAYNWGVIGQDGVVAPVHSVFVQAVPFLSSNSVPSAPLAPGAVWGEHGVRFDVGMTSGFLRGSTWPKPGGFVIGGGLYAALCLEWLIVNTDETGRFRFGASIGVGL